MPVEVGSRLGVYEIIGLLGAGGMGEVYRARDTRLGRDVAIKFLAEPFLADPERVARFEREAQVLAALNHPHIAAIYGVERTAATSFLVLEFVDGESLDARIRALGSGGLPLDEALATASQVAVALEAAHEKGIVHRDLKPANVMLTHTSQVKVLDFGLAKFEPGSPSSASADVLTHSPTLTFAQTQAGMILGTAAYMSPEQARGRAADKRSDIWAFGCVLFEMLTGQRAFGGDNLTDVVAAIVRGEPDWSALPKDVPAHVRILLTRCLAKDRNARAGDMAVVRYVLSEPGAAPTPSVTTIQRPPVASTLLVTLMVVLVAIVTSGLTWIAMRRTSEVRPVAKFRFAPAAEISVGSAPDRNVVISADGTHIVGATAGQLWVRRLDQLEAAPLEGSAGARSPFLSPDGRWVGFFAAGEIKKVAIDGGPAVTLCKYVGAPRGGSWGSDDAIVFATSDPASGLWTVPAGGGDPTRLTAPDPSKGELDHVLPSIVPDRQAVLFTITQAEGDAPTIALLDRKTSAIKILLRGGSQAEYVERGYLVYAAAGTLRAVRMDIERFEVHDAPVPVLSTVAASGTGAASFSVSRSGTLVYVPGSLVEGLTLVWVDRQGHEEPIPVPPRSFISARLSPDGSRVALDTRDQEQGIWIWEFAKQTLTRLTFEPGFKSSPIWSADGRHVIYASNRYGQTNIFWTLADGTGTPEALTRSANAQLPHSVSSDGARLIYREIGAPKGMDVMALSLDTRREVQPLVQDPGDQQNAEPSPDARWLAYQSGEGESQRPEVYVRPFRDVNAGRWQISTRGGTRPMWSRDGRELFYVDLRGTLMQVGVQPGASFSSTTPVKVLDSVGVVSGIAYRPWDISRDGKRFLMLRSAVPESNRRSSFSADLVVTLNWTEELKARLPPK